MDGVVSSVSIRSVVAVIQREVEVLNLLENRSVYGKVTGNVG